MLALLISNGNAFHSFGAAQVKERSPSVSLDLKRGQLSKRLSLDNSLTDETEGSQADL